MILKYSLSFGNHSASWYDGTSNVASHAVTRYGGIVIIIRRFVIIERDIDTDINVS